MEDADGQEIISGEIYRNVRATALDFDVSYSNIYLVRQLPSGLVVAKDGYGVHHRVWSKEETAEMCVSQPTALMRRIQAGTLFRCDKQDAFILQEKLERAQDRIPGLLSLLNMQNQPICQEQSQVPSTACKEVNYFEVGMTEDLKVVPLG